MSGQLEMPGGGICVLRLFCKRRKFIGHLMGEKGHQCFNAHVHGRTCGLCLAAPISHSSRPLQERRHTWRCVCMCNNPMKRLSIGSRSVSQRRGNAGSSVGVRIFTSASVLPLLQRRLGANPALGKHWREKERACNQVTVCFVTCVRPA